MSRGGGTASHGLSNDGVVHSLHPTTSARDLHRLLFWEPRTASDVVEHLGDVGVELLLPGAPEGFADLGPGVPCREHVTVTRHGRPAAVLIPVAEYDALEETADILSDDSMLDAILDALDVLGPDPDVGHRLRGRLTELRSYRVGAYRFIDELRQDATVRVPAIRHRGQAYETDPR